MLLQTIHPVLLQLAKTMSMNIGMLFSKAYSYFSTDL